MPDGVPSPFFYPIFPEHHVWLVSEDPRKVSLDSEQFEEQHVHRFRIARILCIVSNCPKTFPENSI